MIRQAENLGESSGINVSCEVPCRVLECVNWKIILENSRESIFFIDEENYFIKTEEFASAIRGSENYFVLITRENLYNLPYSVEEIYGLHVSGKYRDTRKIYQKMYQIYPKTARLPVRVQKIITEDSNSGYQFLKMYVQKGILHVKALVENKNTGNDRQGRNRRNLYYCGRCCNWSRNESSQQ